MAVAVAQAAPQANPAPQSVGVIAKAKRWWSKAWRWLVAAAKPVLITLAAAATIIALGVAIAVVLPTVAPVIVAAAGLAWPFVQKFAPRIGEVVIEIFLHEKARFRTYARNFLIIIAVLIIAIVLTLAIGGRPAQLLLVVSIVALISVMTFYGTDLITTALALLWMVRELGSALLPLSLLHVLQNDPYRIWKLPLLCALLFLGTEPFRYWPRDQRLRALVLLGLQISILSPDLDNIVILNAHVMYRLFYVILLSVLVFLRGDLEFLIGLIVLCDEYTASTGIDVRKVLIDLRNLVTPLVLHHLLSRNASRYISYLCAMLAAVVRLGILRYVIMNMLLPEMGASPLGLAITFFSAAYAGLVLVTLAMQLTQCSSIGGRLLFWTGINVGKHWWKKIA